MQQQPTARPPAPAEPGGAVARALEALALFHPADRVEAFALLRMYARRHELTAADRAAVLAHYQQAPQCCGQVGHESWCPTVNPGVAAQVRTDEQIDGGDR